MFSFSSIKYLNIKSLFSRIFYIFYNFAIIEKDLISQLKSFIFGHSMTLLMSKNKKDPTESNKEGGV
ncbi:hypothetical protein BpHYR1_006715 [Brachionus plicatilis]|uniref:Uncharacterized protein n=1 Tax=Brachionus plicatilis TaxID=10195 RepID=A0A3M7RR74_BRAPC|nr:hypothetical protein BpHYR1_006715 [Brachionus plicatilis]